MRPLAIVIAVSATIVTCAAQSRSGASGGHGGYSGVGRSYYSGGGRSGFVSPPGGSIINPGTPNGLRWNGSSNAWRGYGSGYRSPYYGGGLVFAYPMYFGVSPYDYGYLPQGSPPPQGYYDDSQSGPPPPGVVINQNFIAPQANPMVRDYGPEDQPGDDMRSYQNIPPRTGEAEATIYLIAFRDHTVIPALGWWVEGKTIKYVTMDHDINQASVDLIDRDLSRKLNAQRNIDFTLPPPQG